MSTTVEMLIREAAGLNTVRDGIDKAASHHVDKVEAKKISTGLMKIASLPYKEAAYNSVKEIMKLAASSLDSLAIAVSERDEQISQLTKVAEVRGIIDTMLDRRLIELSDVTEKTAELLKKSSHDLEITKEAIAIGSITSKNIFFEESEKTASVSKRGMFDGVEGL